MAKSIGPICNVQMDMGIYRKERAAYPPQLASWEAFCRFSMESPSSTTISLQAPLSVITLLEEGLQNFQPHHYAEGAAILTLARQHLSPELASLATLLDAVERECMKYTGLQRQLHALGVQYANISHEMSASGEILRALQEQLLVEIKKAFATSLVQAPSQEPDPPVVELYAVCLGPFELRRNGVPITLCANRNGQAILRYLIMQPGYRASVDTLRGLFWPEDPEEVACHKLHVAISTLRQSLQSPETPHEQYILYKRRTYCLDPALNWRSDVEEFQMFYNAGNKASGKSAIACYEKACKLYTCPLLLEDLFADWSFLHRKHLSQLYEKMCHALTALYIEEQDYETAASWALKILAANNCDESAYRLLMSIYAREGRRHDALQLYLRCQHILQEELNVAPMPETEKLYQMILQGEVPSDLFLTVELSSQGR